MKKIILLSLLLEFIFVYLASSQEPCPPTNNWDSDGFNFTRTGLVSNLGYWGSVSAYYKTNPDGSIDVKADWSTLVNQSPYRLTANEFKGFMYPAIIKRLLSNRSYPEIVNVSFYELSECFVDNPCYLKANQTASVFCKDNLWPGPDPQVIIDSQTGTRMWVILNKVSCGYKCCKTTYTVQCAQTSDPSDSPTIIGSPVQSAYYNCPPSTILDCYFNILKDCSATCPLIQDLP